MCPKYYVPFFFLDGTYTLKKIAATFDFDLPPVPAPSKRLSAVCRALTDGALEPFFQWYSCALIGKIIEVPPITLDELRKDEYFGNNSFVNRNVQGMSVFIGKIKKRR